MKLNSCRFPVATLLFLLASLLAVTTSFAQKNLQPGVIVNTSKDTLRGFIDYRNWGKNPDQIEFYRTQNDIATVYTPAEIQSFEVSGESYKTEIVTIDESPFRTENLKEEVKFNYVTDTVFLLNLVNGEKNLYHLKDINGKEHFFITNNSAMELLFSKRYLKKDDQGHLTVAQNKKYVGQLTIYLQGCSTLQSMLAELKYERNDMVRLFQSYYECTNTKMAAENKATSKSEFGVLAGVSFTKLTYFNGMPYFVDGNYPVSTNVSGGVFYNIVFPRNFGRLSICNQFLYYSYKTESVYEDAVTTSIGLNYIMMNNMVRKKFPIKKVDFFVEGGTAVGFGFNETNYQKFEETGLQRASEGKAFKELSKLYLGVNLGLGFQYKKYSIESRYMFGFKKTDFIYQGGSVGSRTNGAFAMLGYQF
jgi:hypothetical protein